MTPGDEPRWPGGRIVRVLTETERREAAFIRVYRVVRASSTRRGRLALIFNAPDEVAAKLDA